MKQTIAFKNSGNFWETRYSFVASCIAWVKDIMVSSPIVAVHGGNFQDAGLSAAEAMSVSWRHDESAPTNNEFFGDEAVSSGVHVVFNANPSANKIFKSISVESPDYRTMTSDATNLFVVNNGTGNSISKTLKPYPLKERGGILYGGIGQQTGKTVASVEYMGMCTSIQNIADIPGLADEIGTEEGQVIFLDGSASSTFSGLDAVLTNNPLTEEDPDAPFVPSVPQVEVPITYKGGIVATGPHYCSIDAPVYAMYLANNGDQAKGQFADLAILFGNDDFEVFALNVDYEPTNLDHNS